MAVIKIARRERGYALISNAIADDKAISFKARGILLYLLAKPDDWEVNIKNIVNASDRDGRDSVYAGIKELMQAGYIERAMTYDEVRRISGVEYVVYESPQRAAIDDALNDEIDSLVVDRDVAEIVKDATRQGPPTGPEATAALAYAVGMIDHEIHVIKKNGERAIIEDEKLRDWQALYTSIDVREEVRKAAAWCLANPRKRKINVDRFLVNWLSRASKTALSKQRRINNEDGDFADGYKGLQ